MTPKLAVIDYLIIFVMMLIVALLFHFASKETIVPLKDKDGNDTGAFAVKRGFIKQPNATAVKQSAERKKGN